MNETLLKIEELSAAYGEQNVISGINLSLSEAGIVCIAGKSGSGKTSLIKAIHGFGGLRITGGKITYITSSPVPHPAPAAEPQHIPDTPHQPGSNPSLQYRPDAPPQHNTYTPLRRSVDMATLSAEERRKLMGAGIGVIPQDPATSFNPIRRYDRQFREALAAHGMEYEEERTVKMLSDIGLKDGRAILRSRPYELSGGMNQRAAIASALMFKPRLLLCDEITSALDVTSADMVINALMDARERYGTSILMLTHNLSIAGFMADNIGIMKDGRIIEYGAPDRVFGSPQQDYTKELLRSIPR